MQHTAEPETFDDPGPLEPQPPSRARRVATVAILILLIVSMVFLAFVSGRGIVTPAPIGPDRPVASAPVAIARLAVVDAAGRLTTTDAPGVAAPVRLGAASVIYTFPVWSPSGDRVAVIGQEGATFGVYVATVPAAPGADTAPLPIYTSAEQPPFYISWAPDGGRVAFLTTEAGGDLALRVAPADGSTEAVIVRNGAPMYWAWTPTGGMLIHSGGKAPDAFVGEVDAAGTSLEKAAVVPGGFRAPAVSADGTFRAYVGPGETTSDQVIVERRDGTAERHGADVHGAAAIQFGPTGSDLAFVAPDRPGREVALPIGPLRLMDATTGDVRVLLTGSVIAFFWAPDGKRIAALQIAAPTDNQVTRVDGSGAAVLARAGTGRTAAEAPGLALRLVFVDPATGAVESARPIQAGTIFAAHILPYFDQYALSHRFWSSDSRSVALPVAADDGTEGIVVFPADGGAATRIADGVAAAWGP